MENNQKIGGLQQEIEDRQNQLDEYDELQKDKLETFEKENE